MNSVVLDEILQALENGGAEVAAVGASVVVRVGHVRFEFGERHFRLFDAQIAFYVAPVFLFLVISVAAASATAPSRLAKVASSPPFKKGTIRMLFEPVLEKTRPQGAAGSRAGAAGARARPHPREF